MPESSMSDKHVKKRCRHEPMIPVSEFSQLCVQSNETQPNPLFDSADEFDLEDRIFGHEDNSIPKAVDADNYIDDHLWFDSTSKPSSPRMFELFENSHHQYNNTDKLSSINSDFGHSDKMMFSPRELRSIKAMNKAMTFQWDNKAPASPFPSLYGVTTGTYHQMHPNSVPSTLLDQPSVGYTGLENLGNTCFMNVVIQCLSNTAELRDYFAHGHFMEDINEDNPLGSGGHLAIAFTVLIRHLWSGKHSYYSPSKLKSLLSEKFSLFSGFSQQDAQEYMSVFLDLLHEDINRIREKPYVELNSKDGDDDLSVPDEELADETWHKYRMRNDSIIVDLFYGQYKSRVACPVCPKVSITFDPFLSLPVPLPKAQVFHSVYFFSRDAIKKPARHLVRLPQDSKVGSLLLAISGRTGIEVSNLRAILVRDGTILSILKVGNGIPIVNDNEMILMFECINPNKSQEDVFEFTVLQRLSVPKSLSNSRCAGCNKYPNNGGKLKRCTKCFRSSYCNKECQSSDWPYHKTLCTYEPEPVGCPFILSLPKSECTFAKLCQTISDYSKHSVDVNFPQSQTSPTYEYADIKDNDSGIYSDTTENSTFSSSSSASSSSSSSSISSIPRFVLHHHPNHIDTTSSDENIIKESDGKKDSILDDLANKHYISVEWNNKSDDSMIVETKDLDHSYNILEAQKVSSISDEHTLEECLRLFIEPEVLSNMEAWYCNKCKAHREATKQLTIWRVPPILVIQLKRFHFKNLYLKEKLSKFVKFPLRDLDMSPYMCPNMTKEGALKPIYDLYAVINHYGNLLGGHYTAFARTRYQNRDLGWRCFDDNRVEDMQESDVVTSNAYILFYRLREEEGEEDNNSFD